MTDSRFIRRFTRCSAAFGLISAAAWAQVGAPVLGYVPDRGRILPVRGIPASASIGAPLNFGSSFLQAVVAPHQDFALVSSSGSGAMLLAYPDGSTKAIAGATASPDSISFSPTGSSAVLWFGSSHRIEVLSGLPSSPSMRGFDASFLSGASSDVPSALSVSDDGAWAAGAWPSGVWAVGPNGEVRSLFTSEPAFALAFFTGRQDLALATRSGISSVTDIGGAAAVASMYSAPSQQSPSGLGISSDNQTVVMSGRRGSILTLHLATGESSSVDCGCLSNGVHPMGGALFRITGLTGSVVRVFDANLGSVFLIPLSPGVQDEPSSLGRGTRLTGGLQ